MEIGVNLDRGKDVLSHVAEEQKLVQENATTQLQSLVATLVKAKEWKCEGALHQHVLVSMFTRENILYHV